MSSLEFSDEVNSSEDEDFIIAKMETKSGLPHKNTKITGALVAGKMIQSDTSVATVTMSSVIMKRGDNLYDTSESEDEDIMTDRNENSPVSVSEKTKNSGNSNADINFMTKPSIHSDTSTNSSFKTVKSCENSSINLSTETTVNSNGNVQSKVSTQTQSGGSSSPKRVPDKLLNGSKEQELSPSYKDSRFNPFDRDLHVDEDHFEQKNEFKQTGTHFGRLKSDSNASSTWTDGSTPASNNSEDMTLTFADLGLAEDHYSQPEGYFGMSSTEELEMAIETCKEYILLAPEHSDKQKNLIKTLINLRMKLQELKEGPEPIEDGVKVVVGHKFELRSGASTKHYCEKCNAVIWGMLQQWYKCKKCGYSAHAKCLNQITRTCASVRVATDPTYCLSICQDRGLSSQNYRCAECRGQISYKSGFSEPRICDYSGSYYCELCHWNDTMLIPARVLHNWDFDEAKVCRASKQYLKLMETKAVIRIQDINPMLFSFVEELNEVRKLREELLIMKKYILICDIAMNNKLLLQLKSRQHFVESSDIYCMQDLIDVQRDTLLPQLVQVHSSWAQHIKTDCQLCKAKGFICELCDIDEILFPFDNIAVVCSECSCVLHRHCFVKRGGICPRCERRSRRKNN